MNYSDVLEKTLSLDIGGKSIPLKLPLPQLAKEGTVRIIWNNFSSTCNIMNRNPVDVQPFFQEELATKITINENKQLVIHGRNKYTTENIQKILVRFITERVNCPSCKSPHTKLCRNNKFVRIICENCGAEHF